jgi:hypothetical protein
MRLRSALVSIRIAHDANDTVQGVIPTKVGIHFCYEEFTLLPFAFFAFLPLKRERKLRKWIPALRARMTTMANGKNGLRQRYAFARGANDTGGFGFCAQRKS